MDEFLIAYLSVLILIGLLHDLVYDPHRKLHAHLLDLLMKLIPADLSAVVLIKIFEYVIQVVLP